MPERSFRPSSYFLSESYKNIKKKIAIGGYQKISVFGGLILLKIPVVYEIGRHDSE